MRDLCICPGCGGRTYHRTCWPKAFFHLPSDGCEDLCKQPTDFVEYVWIHYLLKSQNTRQEQAVLHKEDMWSSWISVPNQQDSAKIYIYPRLQYLINNAQALRDDIKAVEQFPSLVSFFGDTGYAQILIRFLYRSYLAISVCFILKHVMLQDTLHWSGPYCDPGC